MNDTPAQTSDTSGGIILNVPTAPNPGTDLPGQIPPPPPLSSPPPPPPPPQDLPDTFLPQQPTSNSAQFTAPQQTIPPPPPASGEVFLTGIGSSDDSSIPHGHSSPPKALLVFAAIIIFSGLIVGGLFLIQKRGQAPEQTPTVVDTNQLVSPTPLPPQELTLVLDDPKQATVAATAEIAVSGKTSPGAVVIFFTDAHEDSLESDSSGAFNGKIKLEGGANKLSVFAIGKQGQEGSTTRDVTYESTSSATSSPSAAKKLMHGTVTGINESVITVLEDGMLEKFSNITATGSAVVKTTGNKSASLTSLELGAKIAVVGIPGNESSLVAKLLHIISTGL